MELLNAGRPAWQAHAACAGRLDRTWVPDPRRGDTTEQKALCAGCRVRDECLAFGVRTSSVGIYGGLDELERKAIKKSREAPAAAA